MWTVRRVLVVLLGTAGIAILLYPAAGAWFSARDQAGTVTAYVETVRSMEPEDTRAELAAAHAYNRDLPRGPLRDPYGDSGTVRESATGSDVDRYLRTLDVGDDGIIGVLAIPRVAVNLPVYHGTGARALELGAGHLYGSALPVGGPGTHAVLTGHSGVAGITLLSDLPDVLLGDTFTVTVLDRTLHYRVDQIRTVLPEDTTELQPVPGKDYVTLVTCTPYGVNTHRLLVRGVRVPAPEVGAEPAFLHGRAGPGFPWWAFEGIGGLVVLVLITRRLGSRSPKRRPARRAGPLFPRTRC